MERGIAEVVFAFVVGHGFFEELLQDRLATRHAHHHPEELERPQRRTLFFPQRRAILRCLTSQPTI